MATSDDLPLREGLRQDLRDIKEEEFYTRRQTIMLDIIIVLYFVVSHTEYIPDFSPL